MSRDKHPEAEHPTTPQVIQANVRTIAEMESRLLQQRSGAERMGDLIARAAGSPTFFLVNLVWYLAWIVLNLGLVPGLRPFDPYPFTFLTLVVSLEAIFLAISVLSSQNTMARIADQRAHLDLQVNLLAEQENTTMLNLLQAMAVKMGLKVAVADAEATELSGKTDATTLAYELEKSLPAS